MPTLEQIQIKIAKLQAQAEAIAAKKASVVLKQIASLMHKHGLTTEHIASHLATRKPRGRPAKSTRVASTDAPKRRGRPPKAAGAAPKKDKLPAKYRNPETGETWSGHARPPAWIKEVADRSVYLIAGATSASKPAAKKSAGRKAVARKTAKTTGVKRVARKAVSAEATSKPVTRRGRRPSVKNEQAVAASA